MAQKAQVPKFGDWESNGSVPYTQYFNNARKGRIESKLINPNDPQENPGAFPEDVPPIHSLSHSSGPDPEVPKPKDERRVSREDVDLRRPNSPPRHDAMARKPPESPYHQYGERTNSGDTQKKANRTSSGFDRSFENSPLHPHYLAKSAGKGGVSSPSWERKGSSEGSHGHAPNTPGRSRLRAGGQGDETPVRTSAVPKFGEWDENNPASADGFTQLFNKVREERQADTGNGPIISNDSTYPGGYGQDNSLSSPGCWCFSWLKK